MESTPNSVGSPTLVELKNSRRACKSLKLATLDGKSQFLLASDIMFGSTEMDGKFKLISTEVIRDLKNSEANYTFEKSPGTNIVEDHYFEVDCGVTDANSFSLNKTDYIIIGLEDGSLHIYNMTKNLGKSFSRPVSKKAASSLSNLYD
jgi:hypothetical protein